MASRDPKRGFDSLPPAHNGHVILVNGGHPYDGSATYHDGKYFLLYNKGKCRQLQNGKFT